MGEVLPDMVVSVPAGAMRAAQNAQIAVIPIPASASNPDIHASALSGWAAP